MIGKPLVRIGSSLARLREFPREARRRCGHELERVQEGRAPSDWKSVPEIALGVVEVRVHVQAEYRVLYVARFPEAVYVLHVFEKRTRRMSRSDMDLARSRFSEMLRQRIQGRQTK